LQFVRDFEQGHAWNYSSTSDDLWIASTRTPLQNESSEPP
jgi:hypothetical protein